MKFVTAILRPHKLDDVREALSEVGGSGITTFVVLNSVVTPTLRMLCYGVRFRNWKRQ